MPLYMSYETIFNSSAVSRNWTQSKNRTDVRAGLRVWKSFSKLSYVLSIIELFIFKEDVCMYGCILDMYQFHMEIKRQFLTAKEMRF